jgi:hypothetical protein
MLKNGHYCCGLGGEEFQRPARSRRSPNRRKGVGVPTMDPSTGSNLQEALNRFELDFNQNGVQISEIVGQK